MARIVLLRGVAWPVIASSLLAGVTVGIAGLFMVNVRLTLLLVSCALLATAAAFVLDEQASEVADVTPAIGRQLRVRACLVAIPLAAGCLLVAAVPANIDVPRWQLLLAFSGAPTLAVTVARLRRRSSGLPGMVAGVTAMAVLVVPTEVGRLSPIHTFPASAGAAPMVGPVIWWVFSNATCASLLLLPMRKVLVATQP